MKLQYKFTKVVAGACPGIARGGQNIATVSGP